MVEALSAEDVAALDPGIRDLVVKLREADYETTDSGDGVSKPADWYESGDAMPFPHVAVHVPDTWRQDLIIFANDLYEWLQSHGYPSFTVEASYVPGQSAICMVRPKFTWKDVR